MQLKLEWKSMDEPLLICSGWKIYFLTDCILVDSATVICWASPIVILGVLGLFCHFYSIFDGKSC